MLWREVNLRNIVDQKTMIGSGKKALNYIYFEFTTMYRPMKSLSTDLGHSCNVQILRALDEEQFPRPDFSS